MKSRKNKTSGKTWHKVTVSVANDDADMVRRAIQSSHCCGIQEEDEDKENKHLDAYFDDAIDPSELHLHLELIAELISAAGGRKLQMGAVEEVPEEDWMERWRREWKPVRISKDLVVCPSWETVPDAPGQTVVFIYPQMAFGTGSHPTTQMCLKLLERHMQPEARVIDIGAGSCILSIAAAKLGAKRVVAVEREDAAIDNANENCRINRVKSKIKIVHGRFGPKTCGNFDLGVCNMLSHVMLPLVGDITRLLAGKSLIGSGLTHESMPEVKRELTRRGWRFKKTLSDGEWVGFLATRND